MFVKLIITKTVAGGKMKRLITTTLIVVLGILFINGCTQRRVAQVSERPDDGISQKAYIRPEDKQKTEPSDAAGTGMIPKETITEKELARLQPSDAVLAIKELRTKIRDIYFDFDSYEIRDDAKPILKEAASILLKNKNIKIIIEGHCDDRGTNEYNLALGDRRAGSVKDYLVSLGIASVRVETISYGEEKSVCNEQTEDCWAKNRRAHFVFIEGAK